MLSSSLTAAIVFAVAHAQNWDDLSRDWIATPSCPQDFTWSEHLGKCENVWNQEPTCAARHQRWHSGLKSCVERCEPGFQWVKLISGRKGRCVAPPTWTRAAMTPCAEKGLGWSWMAQECVVETTPEKATLAWNQGETIENQDAAFSTYPWSQVALKCVADVDLAAKVQTCRYNKCLLVNHKVDKRICYRTKCNRKGVMAQVHDDCKAAGIEALRQAALSTACQPAQPLTGLQRQCVAARCAADTPLINKRVCAMNRCTIQLEDAVACWAEQSIRCEEGDRWDVNTLGCVSK